MRRSWITCPLAALALLALVAGCATRVVPPLPVALAYPEFVYPTLPQPLATADAAERIDRGWRFLQNGDLGSAEREFAEASQGTPALYPALAGGAYVALARGDYDRALGSFDAVLQEAAMYVPALAGRGQTLLALNQNTAALEAFEALLAADPSLADVRSRIDVLRFRSLQDLIEAARGAAAAGRAAEARNAYEQALQVSPDSAFLYRELGLLEREQGNLDAGLDRFSRAADLDPGDSVSLTQLGELLDERRDFVGAEAAYRRAADIAPSDDLNARIAAIVQRARDAQLPTQFRAMAGSNRISRGDLAALLGVRLEDILQEAPEQDVVMTDTQGHWATSWIVQVARAGIIDPFANHTFQPGTLITRSDLAGAVSRVAAVMAVSRPEIRRRLAERPQIADMGPEHLSYPAVSAAVASGVMLLLDGARFEVARPVSGAEAIDVVTRLLALAGSPR
jgi:tetratricopeptide (TPR) repeat protein